MASAPDPAVFVEDDFDDHDFLVRAKWTIDGASSLEEAAIMAEGFAAYLRDLHDRGFVLRGPVNDDYGFFYHPDGLSLDQETD